MEYITVKEASKKWGYSEATIRKWCKDGLLSISYAPVKKNGRWKIPKAAECPKSVRVVS